MRIDMSKASTPKRGRPATETPKARPSITMDAEIVKSARRMALADGLAFSTWLEQLVRSKLEGAQ